MKQIVDATRKATDPPVLFSSQGHWFKFSEYELESDSTGRARRIKPKKEAALTRYKAFEKYPNVLRDYLQLAREIEPRPILKADITHDEFVLNQQDEISVEGHNRRARAILRFVNKYGPIGAFWECADSFYIANFKAEESGQVQLEGEGFAYINRRSALLTAVFGIRNPPTGSIPFWDYAEPFITSEIPRNEKEFYCAEAYWEPFLRHYAEPLAAIRQDATELLRWAREWERFRYGGFSPTDAYVYSDGHTNPQLSWSAWLPKYCPTGLALRFNGHIQIDYTFRSLAGAMKIMFLLNRASELQPIGLCALQECGEPFIARNERGRYCSDSHANLDRQRRFQQKKGAKKHGRQRTRKGER